MKLLALADIHQGTDKWQMLVETCKDLQGKIDIVAISGDLFPKNVSIIKQNKRTQLLKESAQQIRNYGMELVLIMGNDDNQNLIPFMEEEDRNGLWHYVSEKVAIIKDYEFIGMPWVPDHPFGYKFWCRSEFKDDLGRDPLQYGKPCLVNSNNQYKNIDDYEAFLKNQPSIYDVLSKLASQVMNLNKSIWLIHAPPTDLRLDMCSNGQCVGSKAVLKFIDDYKPMLTIHGHIHESPEYNGNRWCVQYNQTFCVQCGQLMPYLYYSILEIENGQIINRKHSIYGT